MLKNLLYFVVLAFGIGLFAVTVNAQTGIRGNWKAISIIEKPDMEVIPKDGKVTLNIQGKNLSGTGGCNRISGEYKIVGRKIKIKQLMTTLMACDHVHYDHVYYKLLSESTSYTLKGKTLIFKDKNGRTILRFERVKS